jgi:hypothetical protein
MKETISMSHSEEQKNMTDHKLLMYRVNMLEKNQQSLAESNRILAEGISEINRTIVSIKTWGKAGLLLHPIFVGLIVYMATGSN